MEIEKEKEIQDQTFVISDLNSKLVLQNFQEIEKDIKQINKDIEELRLKIYEDFHLMSKHEKDNYEAQ